MYSQCGLRTVAQKVTPHAARAMRVHVLTMWPSYGGPKGHSTRCQGYEGTCTHNVAFVRWPKGRLHTLPGLSGYMYTQCGLRTVAQMDSPRAARAIRVHVHKMWPSYGGPNGQSTRCQGYQGTCTHNVTFVRWPKWTLHTLPGLSGYMYTQCGLRTVAQMDTPHAARAIRVHVHTMWPSYGGPNGHSTRCQGYQGTCTHNVAFARWPKWTLHTLPGLSGYMYTQCGLRTVAQKETPHAARAIRVHVHTMWPSYGGPNGHSTRCQGYQGTCTHNVAFARWPKRRLHALSGWRNWGQRGDSPPGLNMGGGGGWNAPQVP